MVEAGVLEELVSALRSAPDNIKFLAVSVIGSLTSKKAAAACVAAGAVYHLLHLIANNTNCHHRDDACLTLARISTNEQSIRAICSHPVDGIRTLLRLLRDPLFHVEPHEQAFHSVAVIVHNMCIYGSAADACTLLVDAGVVPLLIGCLAPHRHHSVVKLIVFTLARLMASPGGVRVISLVGEEAGAVETLVQLLSSDEELAADVLEVLLRLSYEDLAALRSEPTISALTAQLGGPHSLKKTLAAGVLHCIIGRNPGSALAAIDASGCTGSIMRATLSDVLSCQTDARPPMDMLDLLRCIASLVVYNCRTFDRGVSDMLGAAGMPPGPLAVICDTLIDGVLGFEPSDSFRQRTDLLAAVICNTLNFEGDYDRAPLTDTAALVAAAVGAATARGAGAAASAEPGAGAGAGGVAAASAEPGAGAGAGGVAAASAKPDAGAGAGGVAASVEPGGAGEPGMVCV